MTSSTLALLFIVVYFIERLAEALNLRSARRPLPESLRDVQTPEDQARAAAYLRDRTRLTWIRESVFLLGFIVLLATGVFGNLQAWAVHSFSSTLTQALAFAAVLALLQAVVNLPFSAYSTFVIEGRYGFNRSTWKIFIGDFIKGVIIGAILGGLIFAFAVWVLERYPTDAWWMIWIGYTLFQLFVMWIAPVTILPLFLKLSPLAEGELRSAIETYARNQHFKLDGVWVCDASRRSAKSNAFFTGFGRFRRLVLFDTLIEKHTTPEIVAVVAHEAGHFKLGHIWKGAILSSVSVLAMLFLLQKLIESPDLYSAFYVEPGNLGIGLILASVVLGKILFFLSPLTAYLSRRNEFAADRFSVDTARDPASLIAGLKRLVKDNLATLQVHPLYVILHATHPPLPDRLQPLIARTALAGSASQTALAGSASRTALEGSVARLTPKKLQ